MIYKDESDFGRTQQFRHLAQNRTLLFVQTAFRERLDKTDDLYYNGEIVFTTLK